MHVHTHGYLSKYVEDERESSQVDADARPAEPLLHILWQRANLQTHTMYWYNCNQQCYLINAYNVSTASKLRHRK